MNTGDEEPLTTEQVAKELHVTTNTVRRYCTEGLLKSSKSTGRRWILRGEVERFKREFWPEYKPKEE